MTPRAPPERVSEQTERVLVLVRQLEGTTLCKVDVGGWSQAWGGELAEGTRLGELHSSPFALPPPMSSSALGAYVQVLTGRHGYRAVRAMRRLSNGPSAQGTGLARPRRAEGREVLVGELARQSRARIRIAPQT